MSILELSKGDRAVISDIKAPEELKQRFYSFGLNKDSVISIGNFGARRSTVQVTVDRTCIALRHDEAAHIFVEKMA